MKDLFLPITVLVIASFCSFIAGEVYGSLREFTLEEAVRTAAVKQQQAQAKVPESAAPSILPVTPITIIMPNNEQAMNKLAKQVAKELAPKLYKPNETCFGPPYGPSDHPQQLVNPMTYPIPIFTYDDQPITQPSPQQ